MKLLSLASATSIALLLSGALLSGCATTKPAGQCDTTQSVGSCAVTVQMQGSRLVVCPVADAAASPVCMNAALDVKRPGRQAQQVQMMLQPGHCQPLNTEVVSATAASCKAFAMRARDAGSTEVAAAK